MASARVAASAALWSLEIMICPHWSVSGRGSNERTASVIARADVLARRDQTRGGRNGGLVVREPAIWSAGIEIFLASEAARVKGAALTSAKAMVPPTQQSPIP